MEGDDSPLQADMNEDGSVNILDIITLVNIISGIQTPFWALKSYVPQSGNSLIIYPIHLDKIRAAKSTILIKFG